MLQIYHLIYLFETNNIGSDINVPPPTLSASKAQPLGPNEIDDGQYREDPAEYYKGQKYNRPVAASKFSLNNFQQQPRPQPTYNPAPAHNPAPAYNSAPAPYRPPAPQYYNPPPQQQPQPQHHQPQYQPNYYQPPAPQPQYNPYNPNSQPSHFHPSVKSLDIWSGSYSLDYTGRK